MKKKIACCNLWATLSRRGRYRFNDNSKMSFIRMVKRWQWMYDVIGGWSLLQWKPLNVITLGPGICDHINRMITITDVVYLVIISKCDLWKVITVCGYTLTVIILSGFYCFHIPCWKFVVLSKALINIAGSSLPKNGFSFFIDLGPNSESSSDSSSSWFCWLTRWLRCRLEQKQMLTFNND